VAQAEQFDHPLAQGLRPWGQRSFCALLVR
jgi:hypothetical protein